MTEKDSQNLHVCCTAQKLSKIKDFLAFAFAKKQSKVKKGKGAKVVRNELLYYFPDNFTYSQLKDFFGSNFALLRITVLPTV